MFSLDTLKNTKVENNPWNHILIKNYIDTNTSISLSQKIQNTFNWKQDEHPDMKGCVKVAHDIENFEYFKAHRLAGVIECALPGWSYTEEEKQFLLEQDLYFLDKPLYFSDYQGIDRKLIDKQAYKSFRGTTWPTLKQFIQGAEPHTDMYTKEFGGFVSDKNRDGYHINYNANSIYADYFYNQWKIKNESQNITQT